MNWASFSLAPCPVHFAQLAVVLAALPVCAQTPSQLELGVLAETNLARTNPTAFADHLEQMLSWFRGDVMYRPGDNVGVRTIEGPAAVREAIAFLRRQQSLPPLVWSAGLGRAARDHAQDQGPTGQTGHSGQDGSTMAQRMTRYGEWQHTAAENIDYGSDDPRQVVISLIVDDGVASRGHRTNIFNPALRVAGVGCGPHQQYRFMCVIDYAGAFEATRREDSPAPVLHQSGDTLLRANRKQRLLRSHR